MNQITLKRKSSLWAAINSEWISQNFCVESTNNIKIKTTCHIINVGRCMWEGPSKHSSWWRRLEDFLKMSFFFVFRGRICSPQPHVFRRRLEDVFKTSWSRPIYSSWLYVFKTSSRRFQGVFKTSCKKVFKPSSRRLQDVSSR